MTILCGWESHVIFLWLRFSCSGVQVRCVIVQLCDGVCLQRLRGTFAGFFIPPTLSRSCRGFAELAETSGAAGTEINPRPFRRPPHPAPLWVCPHRTSNLELRGQNASVNPKMTDFAIVDTLYVVQMIVWVSAPSASYRGFIVYKFLCKLPIYFKWFSICGTDFMRE